MFFAFSLKLSAREDHIDSEPVYVESTLWFRVNSLRKNLESLRCNSNKNLLDDDYEENIAMVVAIALVVVMLLTYLMSRETSLQQRQIISCSSVMMMAFLQYFKTSASMASFPGGLLSSDQAQGWVMIDFCKILNTRVASLDLRPKVSPLTAWLHFTIPKR